MRVAVASNGVSIGSDRNPRRARSFSRREADGVSLEGPGIDGTRREYWASVAKFNIAVAFASRINIGRYGPGVEAVEIYPTGAEVVVIVLGALRDIAG